jgi:predicted TIM-barrel fold metal-dependent hydrolase
MVTISRRQALFGIGAAYATTGYAHAAPKPLGAKLFDTHAHFITDDFAKFPLSPLVPGNRDALTAKFTAAPAREDLMLGWWKEAGVTGGAGVQYRTCYTNDNSYVVSVSDHTHKVHAVVILDPTSPDSPAKLAELATQHPVTGLRMTGPFTDTATPWLNSDGAMRMWETVAAHKLTMVLMPTPPVGAEFSVETRTKFLAAVGTLAEKFPRTPIVLDHFGFPVDDGTPNCGLGDADHLLALHPNVYGKYTWLLWERNSNFRGAVFLRRAVDIYGANHIMWGSDMGNAGGTYMDRVNHMKEASRLLTPKEKKLVYHDVGARLFGAKHA